MMKNFLCGLIVLGLSSIFALPSQAQFTDGEDDRQCREGEYKRENCTLVRRIGLQDPTTGEVTYVYKNWGNGFKRSKQKSDYKRQGLETKGVNFQKRGSTPYYGLRDANGKIVLGTSYPNLWPVSTRHSFVWLSNSTYKMVEHKTHELQPLPIGWIGWKGIFQFRNSDDILNTWVKTIDHGEGIGTWRRVNPDLTLGMTIKNVFFKDNGPFEDAVPGFTNTGAQGVAETKDPQTGQSGSIVFSLTRDVIDTEKDARIFEIVRADTYGKKFTEIVTMTKLEAQLPNLGGTFERALYWPVDASGTLLPKSRDVLGMAPFLNSLDEVTRWLIIRANSEGLEYLIGVEEYRNNARPIEILKRVDELDAYDDIYFFDGGGYAVKIKGGSSLNSWQVEDRIARTYNHARGSVFPSGQAAYASLLAAQQKSEEERLIVSKRNRERTEHITQEIERLLGGVQTSARIAECEMIGNYAKSMSSPSAETRNWLVINRLDAYRACRHIPVRLSNEARAANARTGTSAPTLSDMLEDYGREIAKAPTVLRCTNNGDGTETCQWVNR